MDGSADMNGAAAAFPEGDGESAALIRGRDWASTPIGPLEDWPESLKSLVRLVLASGQPMFVAWGPALNLIYNDAYAPMLGAKHPDMGRPFAELWSEIWPQFEPIVRQTLSGTGTMFRDLPIPMRRHGVLEDTWFSFSYTPVRDESGAIAGLFCVTTETTADVLARVELAESQAQFRAITNSVDQMIWSSTPAGFHDFYNQRWYDFTGVPQGSTDGEGWNDVFHPEDQARAWERWRRSLETGEIYEIEYRLRHRSGEYRWVLGRALPMRDDEGRIVRWFGTCTDIHEAKATEAALRESESRLRIAQTAGRVGTFELIPGEDRIIVSEEFCRLWGLEARPEYAVTALIRLVDPEDQPRIETLRPTLDSGSLRYLEYRIRRPDTGEMRWMARRGEVVTDDTGRRRFIGVSYDITDRKTAEQQLQALNQTLEQQVEARTAERDRVWRLTQDMLGVADQQGVWLSVNPAWTSVLGWSEAELLGRTSEWLEHPDDREKTRTEVARLAAGGTTFAFENRFRTRDGDYRCLSWTAAPDGGLLYTSARDVTEARRSEAELAAAQDALRQAQKMEAVGQLTGGIAHDFNNLLTGIIGSLDLMKRRIEAGRTGELNRFMEAASTSAQRAAALTHRLLAFARRQSLDVKPVDVNALAASMEELLRRTLGEQVELMFALEPGLWRATTDSNQLETALLNLAINARDAMPEGGQLTVETANARLDEAYAALHEEVTPGDYVALCVSDTGEGMDAETAARAFDPFFTTKPIGQGTGLGLSMIYGFVRQSGGHAKIYSEPGRGTTVKLYLPRTDADAGEAASAEAGAAPRGAGETVLVVEDDPAVRMLVLEVLRELGYRVLHAHDAPSARPILKGEETIDLMVSDVGLPGVSGRQLADEARRRRPGLKVLFVTGYAENAAVRSGFLDAGMDMITKPFAVDALASKVREMLGRGEGG